MIRVAIIGAGAVIELLYLDALQNLEKAGVIRVNAVVDTNQSRARLIAGRFKQARALPDIDAAFGTETYELALIASPPSLHATHTIAAFSHGCHVLCEKPAATNVAEGELMNAASRTAGKLLAIGFPRRFQANFADVAAMVGSGGLGEGLRFSYREGSAYDWPASSGAAFDRASSGGGVLIDRGVHLLDQLQWIFGDPIVVERSFDDSLVGGVETNSRLELSFPHARGILGVSWSGPLNNGLHIRGDLGEVELGGDDIRTYRRRVTGGGWMRVPATADWPADMALDGKRKVPRTIKDCVELQCVAMLRSIAYGEPFPVTGAQGAAVQQAVADAYALAEPLDFSWLPEPERAEQRVRHWNRGASVV